jgi:signal transduction histidine kinase
LRRVLAQQGAGDVAAAERAYQEEFVPRLDTVTTDLLELIELNARASVQLARQIERFSELATRVAVVLHGLSVAVALAAAWVIARSARGYERLTQSHRAVLERQVEELETFAARVAHDLRGPMGAANMGLDFALQRAQEPSRAFLERSKRSLLAAAKLLDDLYDFARSGAKPAAVERTEVEPVVRQVLEDLQTSAEEARVQVVTELDGPLEVACGSGVLASILANLVSNAIRYMLDAPVRKVKVIGRAAGVRVRLEVDDTGPGIPLEQLPELFRAFVRGPGRRPGGLGLGLATVKRLVEAHGGQVTVRSTIGKGTTFCVELPRWMPGAQPAFPPGAADAPTQAPHA